jgi:putative ABC transport system permease protein
MWSQTFAVTMLNLHNVRRRGASSSVAVLGIAGVVIVVVGVLSIARGFQRAMTTGGDPQTAIVLRAGASSETGSMLALDSVRLIKEAPGIVRVGAQPLASAEFLMVVKQPQPGAGPPLNVSLRGVEPAAFSLRQVRLVEGRTFQAGRPEVIVGRSAARQFGGLAPGQTTHWSGYAWTVVGVFAADAASAESEVWCDIAMLQQAFHREQSFQSVYAKVESANTFHILRDALTTDPRLEVVARPETEYYAEQSRPLTSLVTTAGVFIGLIMSAGAIFAVMNTMYTAVASRRREIATLRAIGFGRLPIVCSVFAEAVTLASVGGVLGALAAWILVDGYAVSTLNFQSMSQIAFAFAVTPGLILQGVMLAMALGLVGAMWPAWRAATVPIPSGLRDR